MNRVDFNVYYALVNNYIQHISIFAELTSPQCTNPRYNPPEYDIFKEHLIYKAKQTFSDMYSGQDDQVKWYVFLYFKYGILNYQHYRGLLALHNELHYTANGLDPRLDPNADHHDIHNNNIIRAKLKEFFEILIEDELSWFNEYLNRETYDNGNEITEEDKRLFRDIRLFLRSVNVDEYTDALMEYLPQSIDIVNDFIANNRRNNNTWSHRIVNNNQLQERLSRLWSRIFSTVVSRNNHNNFQTPGMLKQMCSGFLIENVEY